LFLQFACYKNNLENLKTTAFSFSFSILLIIMSIAVSLLSEKTYTNNTTNIFTLLSMILVGLTTPLTVVAARVHTISLLWKRWHTSLSSCLRDYVSIPLGGNRYNVTIMYVALMLTMLLGGLWHGAAWTFIIWSGPHGTYLILEKLQKRYLPFKMNQ
jgi:uncharacterized membrane protein YhaH (DUF805 family)